MGTPAVAISTELRARALRLAALSGCDYRTAVRVLFEGPGIIRRVVLRDAIARGLAELERDRPTLTLVTMPPGTRA